MIYFFPSCIYLREIYFRSDLAYARACHALSLVKHHTPRAAMKNDLTNFDSVSWTLIFHILEAFNLPIRFRTWVSNCITTPKFSISINGVSLFWKGLFPSPKGLRQGDPLPLPFIWLWNSSLEFCRRAFLTILSVKIWVLATYASLMTYSFRATQMTSLFSLCIVLLWSSIGFLVCCLTITMGWIAISLI